MADALGIGNEREEIFIIEYSIAKIDKYKVKTLNKRNTILIVKRLSSIHTFV